MNENQTLEMQIKASAQQAKSDVDKLVRSLTNIENVLTNTYLELGRIETKAKQSVPKVKQEVDKVKDSTDKATNSVNKLGKALTLTGLFYGTKKATSTFLNWLDLAVDKTEQMNLFNVVFKNLEKDGIKTFSRLGREALNFQNRMNEAFGTNQTETLKYQGLFQSMGENVGIPDIYSAIMSETMTKLTYDLASLYNKSESTTGEALRAGVYAGQTKPLRAYGVDVTQQSMQPILGELGIDKSVKEMSQAEKEILRYIATLRQAKVAMGDFANTIDSPANQMKVFKQQLVESKVALTSLFIGGFAQILPYANALLMVIKEVCKAIATMFGIELKDYNNGIATQEGLYDDLADSADNATGSVKELKRQVLGFDQIHNINENKDNGSGGGVSGGIDQRLLDAIKGYDNGMDKVRMKATEIRDKIMEWLGFTKKINPLTGETYFEYQGIQKTLKNMWNSFKGLSTQGKILVGLGLVAGAVKLFNAGKKLVTIFGDSGLIKITKSLLSPTKSLISLLRDDMAGGFKGLTSSVGDSINMWSKSLTVMDKFKMTLVGTGGLILSMNGMSSAMRSVSNEGWNLGNSLQTVTSGIGGIVSGALIGGSMFGAMGAEIGACAGAVAMLVSAINGYQTESEKMIVSVQDTTKATNDYLNSLEAKKNALQDDLNANLTMTGVHSKLIEELEKITDGNGKVKDGYESRAKYILGELSNAYGIEYSLTDNIIGNYEEYIAKIRETIKAKEAEYILEANRQAYIDSLQEQTRLYSHMTEQSKAYEEAKRIENQAEAEYNDALEKVNGASSFYYTIVAKKKEKALKKVREETEKARLADEQAKQSYTENVLTIEKYSNLQESVMTGNLEEIEKEIEKYTNSYIENGKLQQESSDTTTERESLNWKIRLENLKNTNKERYDELVKELVLETKAVENITPEQASKWAKLGQTDKDSFLREFNNLNTDVQQQIVDKMYEKGYSISSELQRGIQQKNPTIKVTADTSSAKWSIDNLFNSISRQINASRIFDSLGSLLRRENGGVFSNGSWHNIQQYANGGSPSHGTAFVAGENGAEIVGHINGRTEVLNQSQIASAIFSAVVSAMSQTRNQAVQVELDLHTDEGVVVDRINQKTKQTGVCPIDIPY